MTQDIKKDMILHTITKRLVRNWRTPVRSGAHSSALTGALRSMLLLMLMVWGVNVSWGQVGTDYSGTYYIAAVAGNSGYYLCPTENYYYYDSDDSKYTNDSEYSGNPFLTTYPCKSTSGYDKKKAIWIIKKHPTEEYYHIIHAIDGKYLTYNEPVLSNTGRLRVHLEDSPADDDFALFAIEYQSSTQSYDIISKYAHVNSTYPDKGLPRKYLNINKGNKNSLSGDGDKIDNKINAGGIIGLWTAGSAETTGTGRFFLEDGDLFPAPTITNDVENGTFEITTSLYSGYTIRYTTDGTDPVTDPNNTAQAYDGTPVEVHRNGTIVKAVVMYGNIQLTEIASQEVSTPSPDAPSFEVTCDNELQISTNIATATFYYNYTSDSTDPADPDSSTGTLYEDPVSLPDGAKVKAIAYNGSYASEVSDVYTFVHKTAKPTVVLNETNAVITFDSGVTIHYTTDGTDPDPDDTGENTSPFTLTFDNFDYDHDIDIRIIATSAGRDNSCPQIIIKRPKQPIVSIETDCSDDDIPIRSHTLTFTGTEEGKTYWYALSNGGGQTAPALNTFTEYTPGSTIDLTSIPAWDGTTPTVTLHAYAKDAEGYPSIVVSQDYLLKSTAAPTISHVTLGEVTTVTISGSGTIKYILDGGSEQTYLSPFTVPFGQSHEINATAQVEDEGLSCTTTYYIRLPIDIDNLAAIDDPNGAYNLTADIEDASTHTSFGSEANPFRGLLNGNGHTIKGLKQALFGKTKGAVIYNVILDDVDISSGFTFSGKTAVGAICNYATGKTRIYNCGVLATGSKVTTGKDGYTKISDCSSSVSGGTYVGGIVGYLDGEARVINCFSYANITGGTYVGGIVGRNNVATTSDNLKTMVMNCMFYGDIDVTNTTNRAPIYNGEIITNRGDASGVSNYNYFWAGASYVQNRKINTYNCALAAETRFLQRFEFFRNLLNSNRALAAWWATGSRDQKDEMMKWVMEPSQIGTSTPYPILKVPGRYKSMVYIDDLQINETNHTGSSNSTGTKLSTLSVTVRMGSGGELYAPPGGASIINPSLTLDILDKDPEHFNFNYYKVQLPYYNDVGTGNYTENRVVTGWKIVDISSTSATNSFSTGTMPADATADVDDDNVIALTTPYNFADRKCTQKDLYGTGGSNRIFNQGAYFDVPEGVTSIIIEPYWAKCVYVSDQYPDIVYDQDMSVATDVTNVGGGSRYTNGQPYPINEDDQIVYTSLTDAVNALDPAVELNQDNIKTFIYDKAIVLVGNVHSLSLSSERHAFHYTIMSIDQDRDNEPDYSYILRFDSRVRVHPVRIDFLNVIGLGMAQKSSGGKGTYNFGIMQPFGWFEVTNTALFRVTQFEYDLDGRDESPMILQGGVIEQWVTVGGREESIVPQNSVSYYHVGGNVWFKEFHIGVHQDKIQDQFVSPHPPISVTGGDYDIFYLTGYYNTPNNNYNDNAECYINGGRFGKVAGTGMQGIGGFTLDEEGNKTSYSNGNIIWQIDNADIDEFYAGGINAAHIAEGNIFTVISNSRVDQFCGGPKFGDMNHDKIVVTNATNCTFRTFFGAGYGGNSYNRRYPLNQDNITNINWNNWVQNGATISGNVFEGYKNEYYSEYGGVGARIDYQFIPRSNNLRNVARLFVDYVSFSLATTYDVTSILTDCTITTNTLGRLDLFPQCLGNFYGGGSLGRVVGPVKSTLTNCTVEGNVFGAGYSATLPVVKVMDKSFQTAPYYDEALGTYLEAKLPATTDYTWEHRDEVNNTETAIQLATTTEAGILYTQENLSKSSLGSVNGNVTLTLDGDTKVGTDGDTTGTKGHVYGGGEESYVTGENNKVTVNILGNTEVLGDVFGGGDLGDVEGDTEVNIGEAPDEPSGDEPSGGDPTDEP